MAYTNNNKKVWDTPIWLPTAQFRTATSTTASMTIAKDTTGRYLYYLAGTLFYKYDTWKDMHLKLASPPVAAVTFSSIKYSSEEGYRGNCLSTGGTNTMFIGGLNGDMLIGQKIKIMSGKGMGQERTIISSTGLKVEKSGLVTTASALLMTDTTKRWNINQWVGYQCRIVYGTGASQIRKILYNDTNTLYFQDPNYQQLEVWNNTAFSATAPYAIPTNVAPNQANFYIESTTITVDSNWTVQPDTSSSYVIKSGGVFMLSSVASAPWSSFQFYDCLTDTWTTKTAIGGLLLAALGTDIGMTIITSETPFDSGTGTTASTRTFTDNAKSWAIDRYCNYELRITSGVGMGQRNRIVGNGTNYIEIERPFVTIPDSGSTYEIRGDTNKIYVGGNGASSLYQYNIEYDQWTTGPSIDYGTCRNMSVSFPGQESIAVSTAVRNTGGITSLASAPTAGGSGYAVGDLFNITAGGTIGKGRVEAITTSGVVTAVSLYSAGLTYTTGTGKSTSVISGSGNAALTVNILSTGTVGRITTASYNVNFVSNVSMVDSITFTGYPLWAGTYPILTIDSLTTFDIIITAAGNASALASNGTTLIVDSTKNWVVNEHVGKIVKLDVVGTSPTTQLRRITSNSGTTLTVATLGTQGVNGTSRYAIFNPEAFGRDRIYDLVSENGDGRATSGNSTTLVDNTKTWQVGQWNGFKVRITAGTGVGSEVAISANDATTLTLTAPGFTPDTTTKYAIMGTQGLATGTFAATTLADSTKNWTTNKWAGKRLIMTSGTGQRQETTIQSNTNNTLTFTSVTTVPDATTTYTILGEPPRSTGIELKWLFGVSKTSDKGRWLIFPRGGGSNVMDKYDIINDYWDVTTLFSPQSETLNTGTSYAYDGADMCYFTVGIASDFIYIYSLNLVTDSVDGAFQTTTLQGGTAHIGNLMEVVTSDDGGKFLFIGVNTSKLMYKASIY